MSSEGSAAPRQGRVPASCPPGFGGRYTVQPGDTMFLIAQRFGVSLDALVAANPHIPNPAVLFPGDVLCVPGVAPPPPPPPPPTCPPGSFAYTVQPGDTLFAIARRFNTTVDAILAINPQITNPNLIFPGQVICVPTVPPPTRECCLVLAPADASVPPDARGVALVRPVVQVRPGRTSITVAAHDLPAPSSLGNFDAYEALTFVPSVISWRWRLFATPETVPTWAGTFTEITAPLPSTTVVQVRPVNTQTQAPGSPVLTGTLASCR